MHEDDIGELLTGPQFMDGSPAPIDYIHQPAPDGDLPDARSCDTTFVVVWDDGRVTSSNNSWVSEAYDMADCDYMDGVKSIHAVNEKCELVKITLGDQHRINTDDENPFRFAAAPIMAGKRRVGRVTFTDH